MEPKFSGPAYTVGIEEELMILDPGSYALVNAIDDLLEDSPEGDIKPELMESVLEISTNPCADLREAGAALRALRRQVRDTADKKGLVIGSAGTHPPSTASSKKRPRAGRAGRSLRISPTASGTG